jgi:hypothetical protein
MKNCLIVALTFLMTFVYASAEIVAWKLPFQSLGSRNIESSGAVRYENVPDASLFFKDSDEIWDLKYVWPKMWPNEKITYEWFVWNATSGQFVVKTDWSNIYLINSILKNAWVPRNCRLIFKLYEVPADGAVLTESAKPAAVLSLITKSGCIAKAAWNLTGKSIEVETTTNLDEGGCIASVDLCFSVQTPEQSKAEVVTSFDLNVGEPLWVVRNFDGRIGFDLTVSAAGETLDGNPFERITQIQKGNKIASFQIDRKLIERKYVEGVGWILTKWLKYEFLEQCGSSEQANEDPFLASENSRSPQKALDLDMVAPPEIFRSVLDRPIYDIRKLMAHAGVGLKPTDFVGYDPIEQRIYLFTKEEGSIIRIEALIGPTCQMSPRPMPVITMDGNGQKRLVVKSGHKGRIEHKSGEKSEMLYAIQPTIGSSGDILDINLEYRNEIEQLPISKIKTNITLLDGKPLDINYGTNSECEKRSLIIRAEVLGGVKD